MKFPQNVSLKMGEWDERDAREDEITKIVAPKTAYIVSPSMVVQRSVIKLS